MKRFYFDIETGPRPGAELEAMEPKFMPPFNLKDPAKIEANIAAQRAEWYDRAALHATTGRVLAIGVRSGGQTEVLGDDDGEKDLLIHFWCRVEDAVRSGRILTGFNIARFDVPFLIHRSWKAGVQVPTGLFYGRWLNPGMFKDLREVWQCGDPRQSISLRRVAEFLGLGTKEEGGGKEFAHRWQFDRTAALQYLHLDMSLTESVACALLGPEGAVRVDLELIRSGRMLRQAGTLPAAGDGF